MSGIETKASGADAAAKQALPADAVSVTCKAPVNIAVIKYWGKRDEKLILPINSSLSGTIDIDAMCSTTTITASKTFTADTMSLNDKSETITGNKRLVAVMTELMGRAQDYVCPETKKVLIRKDEWKQYKLRIVSHNNFPTAAGLASSASGYACFTRCLAQLYGVQEAYTGELSAMARQGSGSACRSLYGGWVKWEMGKEQSGKDSIAVQVADHKHWPDMRVIILVANSGQKETSSTAGMEETVQTCPTIKYRAEVLVPERMARMEKYIKERDFHNFATLTMEDSNSFHSVCLETKPPIFYMNETSKRVIAMVHAYNKLAGRNEAAYTFDAGPNAVIYTLKHNVEPLLQLFVGYFFPGDEVKSAPLHDPCKLSSAGRGEFKCGPISGAGASEEAKARDAALLKAVGTRRDGERVYQVIVTQVGDGPRISDERSGSSKSS